MIFPFNMDFPCHWNPEIKCQKNETATAVNISPQMKMST